ncbi:MAG: hypothetical protein V1897_12025, partial [Pseudomonadota bacterium]
MVAMQLVNSVILSLAYIRSEWLPPVFIRFGVVGLSVATDEILDKWVRTGSIIRGVRKCKDVLIGTD